MVERHISWEDRRPRNGRERKLRDSGAPAPRSYLNAKKYLAKCRACKGTNIGLRRRKDQWGKEVLGRVCLDCRRKYAHSYDRTEKIKSYRKTAAQRRRDLKISPGEKYTEINLAWYHAHYKEVHQRLCDNNEIFLVKSMDDPIYFMIPPGVKLAKELL